MIFFHPTLIIRDREEELKLCLLGEGEIIVAGNFICLWFLYVGKCFKCLKETLMRKYYFLPSGVSFEPWPPDLQLVLKCQDFTL